METLVSPYVFPGIPALNVTLSTLLQDVSDHFGVTVAQIKSPTRVRHVTEARHCYMIYAFMATTCSTTAIGAQVFRDHSTVVSVFNLYRGGYPAKKLADEFMSKKTFLKKRSL